MNVLVLMCDHLRYDAIGFHGNPYVHTPNLDRLARRSVRFTRAYCNSPLCGPARHSLATGLHPYRHGVINNKLLPLEGMRTLAHVMRESGRRTGCFGHMHWQRLPGAGLGEDAFPDHGYEEYLAIHHDLGGLTEAQKARHLWENLDATSSATGGPGVVPDEQSYSRQIADHAVRKLRDWHRAGERFLAWVSFDDPHPPFFPPSPLYAKYAAMPLPPPLVRPPGSSPSQEEVGGHDGELGGQELWSQMTALEHRSMKAGYYGLVELADRHIGRVLDTLDELDLWRDTVVLFTVDHGEMLGDYGRYFKSVMWEQAVHMPFFVCHPDLPPGECDALAEHVDVFPTLCECAGVPVPGGLQGRSLKPLLGTRVAPPDWRPYVLAHLNAQAMVRTPDWKLVYRHGAPRHLFDMRGDPGELRCRIGDRADVARELDAMLNRDHPGLFGAVDRILASRRFRRKKQKPKIQLAAVS